MAFLVGSTEPALQRLAVPAVCILIAFLAYASQWLFAHAPDLAPGPLTTVETYTFNGLLFCLWFTYYKACTVDPGRYVFPSSITNKKKGGNKDSDEEEEQGETEAGTGTRQARQRWCQKCNAPKPPRAHHCKMCRRCIPKMDHHCPWTSNCVSLQTFPHFLRFLVYTNLSLWTLLYLLGQRFLALWHDRHLPAYLGPTLTQLSLLTVLFLVAGMTSLALGLLLVSTLKGWIFNTTMIESWEIDRHEAALERRHDAGSSASSWWADYEGRQSGIPADPIEFPYDIGIFANMAAAMGTANPVLWFLPSAGNPQVARSKLGDAGGGAEMKGTGWEYEENGLNDREGLWPPPDPDKIRHARAWRRQRREADLALARDREQRGGDVVAERDAFHRRQERDLLRQRSRIIGELEEVPLEGRSYDDYDFVDYEDNDGEAYAYGSGRPGAVVVQEGKSGWTNADGEHLGDYGVDSDAEFDDPSMVEEEGVMHNVEEDEDVPLAELIRRREVRTNDGEDT